VASVQHIVFALPAIYLNVARDRAICVLPWPAAAAIWVYILLSLVLTRGLLGKDTYMVLLSYHTQTICVLLLLGLLMVLRPTENSVVATDRAVGDKGLEPIDVTRDCVTSCENSDIPSGANSGAVDADLTLINRVWSIIRPAVKTKIMAMVRTAADAVTANDGAGGH
jgi:hypothetical protein